jgi:hypothetical protein
MRGAANGAAYPKVVLAEPNAGNGFSIEVDGVNLIVELIMVDLATRAVCDGGD